MNRRVLFGGFLVVLCLATLWGVWRQRSQLAGLRAELQQLRAQLAARADVSASPGTAEATDARPAARRRRWWRRPSYSGCGARSPGSPSVGSELAGVRAENERLRAQLASRGTNGTAGFQWPPGYMRRSQARMVGYNTPDDTLQSMMWAIQNRDLSNLLQALTPEGAQYLRARADESRQSIDDIFNQEEGFVGLRIVSREQNASDGSLAVEVEMAPGMPSPNYISPDKRAVENSGAVLTRAEARPPAGIGAQPSGCRNVRRSDASGLFGRVRVGESCSLKAALLCSGRRGKEGGISLATGFAQQQQGQFAGVVIAPHGTLAVRHLLAGRDIIPAVGMMIDRMQQQALVFGIRWRDTARRRGYSPRSNPPGDSASPFFSSPVPEDNSPAGPGPAPRLRRLSCPLAPSG